MRDLKNKEQLNYVRSGYTVLDLVRLIKNRHMHTSIRKANTVYHSILDFRI